MLKIRFGDSENGENVDPNTNVHFKRKSDTQISRDNRRAELHNQRNHVNTRSKTKASATNVANLEENVDSTIETFRNSGLVNQSPLSLTPGACSMDYDYSSPLVTVESPPVISREITVTNHNNMSVPASPVHSENTVSENESCCDTVHDDFVLPSVESCKSSDKKRVVRRKYINKHKDVRCHRCSTSDVVAKHVEFIKMYRCGKCRLYICEKCYFGLDRRRFEKHDGHRDRIKELEM